MLGLRLPRSRWYVVSLLATMAVLVVTTVASAATGFKEEVASARWLISFQCPDGSTAVDGRLIERCAVNADPGAAARRPGAHVRADLAVRPEGQANQVIPGGMGAAQDALALGRMATA